MKIGITSLVQLSVYFDELDAGGGLFRGVFQGLQERGLFRGGEDVELRRGEDHDGVCGACFCFFWIWKRARERKREVF